MTCTNCALGITKFLEKKGGKDVNVSFANAEASFSLEEQAELDKIVEGINNLGFKVQDDPDEEEDIDPNTEQEQQKQEQNEMQELSLLSKFLICLTFSLPLFLTMFLPFEFLHNTAVQITLSIPVMVIGWAHFGKSAWYSLKIGVPNMDVLIVLGSTAAFIYSLVGYTLGLGHDFMFFETATMIITLVLLGNYLEQRSVEQTTSSLAELGSLKAEEAKLILPPSPDGLQHIKHIPVKEVQINQEFLVNEGDKIPTDGVVLWGKAMVDESLMTGESVPVVKHINDALVGGTILTFGSIKMRAEKVGKNTTLSKIIDLVKEAQTNKPKVQRIADAVSAVFVPLVIGIALLTFYISYAFFDVSFQNAFLRSVAVLVVACPCAMGLATPTAIMVGIGRAAKNGILFKGANTMETLHKIKQVVFDKTGTLTTGDFEVLKSETAIDRSLFRSILLSLEQHSSHPLAKAIVMELEGMEDIKPFHFEEVREVKGLGIIGKDEEGNTYTAGSYKLVSEFTDDDSHSIYMLKNGKLIAWIDMEDNLKKNSALTVNALDKMGIKTYLLSGDKEDKTAHVADVVNIKNYYANKLPQEKLEIIEELKESGGETAMVGDGINDAPALAKATVGVSLSDATQVAIQSSDVILLNGDLSKLPTAIKISNATVTTIKQNLFWAFFYNILMIPFAALGFLNPMLAALAMALSDVIVIGNSLRLKRKDL